MNATNAIKKIEDRLAHDWDGKGSCCSMCSGVVSSRLPVRNPITGHKKDCPISIVMEALKQRPKKNTPSGWGQT